MRRRIAVVGDKLDNDGEICSYEGPLFLVHGHQAALIGGEAYCPVCKTTGYIAKDGGPRRMNFFTGEIAAHDDVVLCGCPEHPRIFARLAGEAWYDDMAESLGIIGSTAAKNTPSRALSMYDDRFVLRDPSGQPLCDTAYAIERQEGAFEYGVTDHSGHTHMLASVALAEQINVYLAG
ncbi:hypothetical protein BSFA1_19730 [Burkholderia sp. SFA1]|nr:hypothetical protein BSFA1_19730 [Burkholderia sp. SFA1]